MPDLRNVDISTTELVDQFGDYYLNNGQNMNNLHMLPYEPFGTAEEGTIYETDQTVLREGNVRTEEVLQPYQHEFTPKGGVKILPISIFLQNAKVDVKILPNQLKKSWAEFLLSNDLDPVAYPLVAYIIEKYLIPKVQEDLELNAIYKGKYVAPEENVAGAASEIMNGVETILNELEAADKLDWITSGTVPTDVADFVDYVENFVAAIPEKYRYKTKMCIQMNRTLRDRFKKGMRKKYNTYYNQAGLPSGATDNVTVMDHDNITICGQASMIGKNKIWCTPKENFIVPVKGFSNKSAFDVQKIDRYVKFLSDWWIGVGFIQPELIFATEQA